MTQNEPEVVAACGEQAGVELAVRREVRSDSRAAEGLGYGGDHADLARSVAGPAAVPTPLFLSDVAGSNQKSRTARVRSSRRLVVGGTGNLVGGFLAIG
jgi:hypothetical protein